MRSHETIVHKLVAIKSTQSDQLKQAIISHEASTLTPCPDHPEEVLELYCLKCSQAACMVCMVVPHNGHKSSTMENMPKDTAKVLFESAEKLENNYLLTQLRRH